MSSRHPTPEPCPFCGETHEPGPVGEFGTAFEGIEFKLCPKVPDGFLYNDHPYERGPRGQLLRLHPKLRGLAGGQDE